MSPHLKNGLVFFVVAVFASSLRADLVLTTIASFQNQYSPRVFPRAQNPGPLNFDPEGNLFGSTQLGGPDDDGIIFEIPSGAQAAQTLATFNGSDGHGPWGVAIDNNGDLFGTTIDNYLFETPHNSNSIVDTINLGSANIVPTSAPVVAPNGSLYGAAGSEIYEVSTTSRQVESVWQLPSIVSSASTPTFDSRGDLFGTFYSADGSTLYLSVFEIAADNQTVNILATTGEGPELNDSMYPAPQITFDANGNMFMASSPYNPSNEAYVFELARGVNQITTFANMSSDGLDGLGNIVFDPNGDMFGSSFVGGTYGDGLIYEIPSSSQTALPVFDFDGANGIAPNGNLLIGPDGNLYGTTYSGGPPDMSGTVFEITLVPEPSGVVPLLLLVAWVWQRRRKEGA
jgi:uncharacterized repeat protein (TIGR03803 family)